MVSTPDLRPKCLNLTQFQAEKGTGQKPYPLAPHIPNYIAYIREYPCLGTCIVYMCMLETERLSKNTGRQWSKALRATDILLLQEAAKQAEVIVGKAKQQFLSPWEIKPPKDVSLKVQVHVDVNEWFIYSMYKLCNLWLTVQYKWTVLNLHDFVPKLNYIKQCTCTWG